MPLKDELARNINALLTWHDLHLKALAKAAEVSEATLIQITKGRTATNLNVLERLAKQLDVHPATLLGGIDPGPVAKDAFDLAVHFILTCDEPSFKAISAAFEARKVASAKLRKR